MAVTQTNLSTSQNLNGKALEMEIHLLEWTSTTATVELATNLSKIYAWTVSPAFGANAGHGIGPGVYELDEARGTDEVITVAAGAVTVNRFEGDDATALDAEDVIVILYGKS